MAKKANQVEDQGADQTRYLVRLTVRRRQLTEPSNLTCYGFVEALIEEGLLPEDLDLISVELNQDIEPSAGKHHTEVEIWEL